MNTKTHSEQDTEHRKPSVLEDPNGTIVGLNLGPNPIDEPIHGRLSRRPELPEPGVAEHARDHVAAQRAPLWAIQSGVDSELVAAEDGPGRVLRGPAGKLLGLGNQGLVGQVGAGDDDHGAGAHAEGVYGAVFFAEVADVVDEGLARECDLEEVADDGPASWAGWEVEGFGGGFVAEEEPVEEENEEGDGDGDGRDDELEMGGGGGGGGEQRRRGRRRGRGGEERSHADEWQ